MTVHDELRRTMSQLLHDVLERYERAVSDHGTFADLRVGRQFHFGDPDTTLPGRIELVVMNMDARLDPKYDRMRFVSVRVMKSREGGYVSSTCLHGSKGELQQQLQCLSNNPEFLVERVSELAEGLPEETNPDLWR